MPDDTKTQRIVWRKKLARLYMQGAIGYLMTRCEMRYTAQWYAHLRGWKVELTPPQRRKVSHA